MREHIDIPQGLIQEAVKMVRDLYKGTRRNEVCCVRVYDRCMTITIGPAKTNKIEEQYLVHILTEAIADQRVDYDDVYKVILEDIERFCQGILQRVFELMLIEIPREFIDGTDLDEYRVVVKEIVKVIERGSMTLDDLVYEIFDYAEERKGQTKSNNVVNELREMQNTLREILVYDADCVEIDRRGIVKAIERIYKKRMSKMSGWAE